MNPVRLVHPEVEPVSLALAKQWCTVEHDEDNALIEMLIGSARETCEAHLGRTIMLSTWELKVDGLPPAIALPYPRVLQVAALDFVAPSGELQTLDPQDYQLDEASEPAYLVPAYGCAWPEARCEPNAVRVRYRAGWENPDQVPKRVKTWILEHVAHFHRNREAATEGNLQRLPHFDGLIETLRVWG